MPTASGPRKAPPLKTSDKISTDLQGIRRQIVAREEQNRNDAGRPVERQVVQNEPFEPKQFLDLIAEAALRYREEGKMLQYTVLKSESTVKDPETVSIRVANAAMKDFLVDIKQTILPGIRQKLRNSRADIVWEFNTGAGSKPAGPTRSEQLEKLTEEFPLLEDLKNILGLEFD